MRGLLNWGTLLLVTVVVTSGCSASRVGVGYEKRGRGSSSFHLSIAKYYRVPYEEVMVVKKRGIPDEEIPVVFLLASRARVSPSVVVDLRLGGKSWLDISLHFGFGPEIYYVPVKVAVVGPPYGKAYGYYKKMPRKQWRTIVLEDPEVVNLVNLKFMAEFHSHPAEKVIEMRSAGKDFVAIDLELSYGRGAEKSEEQRWKGKEDKAKGKAKGKKKW